MKKFQSYITEGGHAVGHVVPITQANALATIKQVEKTLLKTLKVPNGKWAVLGSAGKKRPDQTSGDIDIGIEMSALLKSAPTKTVTGMFDYVMKVCKRATKNVKDSRGLGVISMEYPIVNVDGTQQGEYVQLDFMVVEDLNYASWAFYSPSYHDSKYKGVYRNFLLAVVAKYIEMSSDKETRERYSISTTGGLTKIKQTLVGKTGKPLAKAKTIESVLISKNPEDIVKFLFGDQYGSNDVMTFEQVFRLVMSSNFKHKKNRKKIIDDFKQFCLNSNLPIPEEVEAM